ncbi:hypothetical protein KIPB_003291, partial [Kipferlia bialata]|eukprot:g3291.t1
MLSSVTTGVLRPLAKAFQVNGREISGPQFDSIINKDSKLLLPSDIETQMMQARSLDIPVGSETILMRSQGRYGPGYNMMYTLDGDTVLSEREDMQDDSVMTRETKDVLYPTPSACIGGMVYQYINGRRIAMAPLDMYRGDRDSRRYWNTLWLSLPCPIPALQDQFRGIQSGVCEGLDDCLYVLGQIGDADQWMWRFDPEAQELGLVPAATPPGLKVSMACVCADTLYVLTLTHLYAYTPRGGWEECGRRPFHRPDNHGDNRMIPIGRHVMFTHVCLTEFDLKEEISHCVAYNTISGEWEVWGCVPDAYPGHLFPRGS